jgi:putative component of membrane protein insertase Oxa1/YidC/SpoIIIJ protein YidD
MGGSASPGRPGSFSRLYSLKRFFPAQGRNRAHQCTVCRVMHGNAFSISGRDPIPADKTTATQQLFIF